MRGALGETGLVAGACLLGLLAHGTANAADIVVDGSEEKSSYDCHRGNAVVNGGDNVLTLRNCARVTVSGADNTVDAGTAHEISVLSSGNRVTWTEVGGGRRPKIVNMGADNVIASSAGGAANTQGDDVVVSAKSGSVVIAGEGKGRAASSSAEGVVVMESGRHDTVDCGGGPASVLGKNNVLTLRSCSELSVAGNSNRIDAGDTPAITVVGQSNQVTWTQGPGGAPPKVSNLGERNVVKRRP